MAVPAYNVLAICAGVGGLELGVRIARPDAVGVVHIEREAFAASTLVARMEDGWLHPAPVWSDVGTFDARPWRGVVDCVTSGDPCQPNSVAGKQLGDSDDRWLVDQVLRIVEECRPRRFFRENVAGNADGQLAAVVPALERMGFRVAAGIFSAAETGASHRRERLFIMGDADHGCDGRLPADARRGSVGRAAADGAGFGARLDVGDAASYGRGEGRAEPVVRSGRDAAADDGCAMANALRAEPQGLGADDRQAGRQEPDGHAPLCGGAGVPLFAPGPGDPLWRAILAERPELKPAVHRVVDGLAPRVDRIRACGNGVFPLAAAYAWRTLEARLAADAGFTVLRSAA